MSTVSLCSVPSGAVSTGVPRAGQEKEKPSNMHLRPTDSTAGELFSKSGDTCVRKGTHCMRISSSTTVRPFASMSSTAWLGGSAFSSC